MKKHFISFFLFSLYFRGFCSSLRWIAEEEIKAYGMYRDVKLTRYDISPGTKQVTWDFRPRRYPANCEEVPIYVVLQYGSIPSLNPNNETYPKYFDVDASHQTRMTLKPDNTSQFLNISSPRPGSWYSASYRPSEEGKIVQSGLSRSCRYFLSLAYDTLEDVQYLPVPTSQSTQLTLTDSISHIKFDVKPETYEFTLSLNDCKPDCDVQIIYLNQLLNSSLPNIVNCSTDNAPCQYTVISPDINLAHRFGLRTINSSTINATLDITLKECIDHEENVTNTTSCIYYKTLDRLQFNNDFNVAFTYVINDTVHPIKLNVTKDVVNVLPFNVQPNLDIGGTLNLELALNSVPLNKSVQHTRVCGYISQNYIPEILNNEEIQQQDNSLCCNSSAKYGGIIYYPYPQPGTWFMSLSVDCYTENDTSINIEPCINATAEVGVSVTTTTCYHGRCSGRGVCKEYINSPSLIVYSTCVCSAGWRGYGCTDNKEAYSVGSQLTEVLLLTLSNLFFIPGILLALKRRYYVEALVYTYNMFFSTFYHACDGDREDVYTLCIMKYNVLSFCDFLGSVCSLWVTVVAMAKVYKPMTVLLQMAAPLFLVIGVLYDRTSLLIIVVPGAVALTLLAVSWALRCKTRKSCYPSWRRYLFFLLPGVVIAATGAMLFAFAETVGNYRYIHSTWHMTLSLSIIFLLPPRKVKKDLALNINTNNDPTTGDNFDNDSDMCLIRPVNNTNLVL